MNPTCLECGNHSLKNHGRIRVTTIMGLALLVLTVLLQTGCQPQRPWNVLLITLDTLRADRLGCYGKPNAGTPYLDRLAEDGVRFQQAVTTNPVTQASHASLFTGTWPMYHGVRDNLFFHIRPRINTLATLLKDQGYATGAAIGGFPLTREFGLNRGFDFFDDRLGMQWEDARGRPNQAANSWYQERPAAMVNQALRPWLVEQVESKKPFFAWLHYWDPHLPYIAPDPFRAQFIGDPYQAEIAYVDHCLGSLIGMLQEAGEWERTVVIVSGDHGEGLMEHREMTHAFLAYEATLRVPLIIRTPHNMTISTVTERVSLVDVAPTLFDLLDLPISDVFQGRSLLPLMHGDTRPSSPIYAESLSPRLSHGFGELRVLYDGPLKLIFGPKPELYRLDLDPKEGDNLVNSHRADFENMTSTLETFIDHHANSDADSAIRVAQDDVRLKLEALGYLSTSGDDVDSVSETLTQQGIAPQDRVLDINSISLLRSYLSSGQYDLAKDVALRLVSLVPDHPYYSAKLAASYLGLEQIAAAAQVVDESNRITAANQDDFLAVTKRVFEDIDQTRGLEMGYRLLHALETPQVHLLLGRLERSIGMFESAGHHLDRGLELEPQNPQFRLEWARLQNDLDQIEAAETLYRSLLTQRPLDVAIQMDFAQMLVQRGRSNEAIPIIKRIMRLAPRNCDAHLVGVQALAALGQHKQALVALDVLMARCDIPEYYDRAKDYLSNEVNDLAP